MEDRQRNRERDQSPLTDQRVRDLLLLADSCPVGKAADDQFLSVLVGSNPFPVALDRRFMFYANAAVLDASVPPILDRIESQRSRQAD